MKSKIFVLSVTILFLSTLNLFAQSSYKQPPKDVLDVLNAAAIPQTSISPAKDKILLLEPLTYPSIAELSQPMLRLAGLRINPNTNGAHRQPYAVKLTLKNIADGKETVVNLPANAQIISRSGARTANTSRREMSHRRAPSCGLSKRRTAKRK